MTQPTRIRRPRPAKPALSREWIVAVTIEIVRREGLEKATMRRVAQELDTGAASLYVYIANTAELHAAVLDELIGSISAPASTEPGVALEALLDAYGRVLFAHPGLARSALVLRPTGPNAIRLYDRVLGLLLALGIEPARAAWGVDLLLQYVTANAAEHSAPTSGDIDAPEDDEADWAEMRRAVRDVDPRRAPHIAAHAEAILGGTSGQRVSWALRTLIAGIAATPLPAADGISD